MSMKLCEMVEGHGWVGSKLRSRVCPPAEFGLSLGRRIPKAMAGTGYENKSNNFY